MVGHVVCILHAAWLLEGKASQTMVQSIIHIALLVANYDEAIAFYTRLNRE
jgi:hypothetical protein